MGIDGYDGYFNDTNETSEVNEKDSNTETEISEDNTEIYEDSPYEEESETPKSSASVEPTDSEKQGYEANSVVREGDERFRTDDNGNRYMDYDKEQGKWSLKENTTYEVNGYKYETDDKGRIEHVEGDLYMKDGERSSLNATVEDMEENDDRGHIVADRFNGSNRIDNLIAQDSGINRGEYKALENELAKAVDEGHDVHVEYEIYYDEESDSKRPEEITVKYTVDGVTKSRTFDN